MSDTLPIPNLHKKSLVWDSHGCLPLRPGGHIGPMLERYNDAGVDFVSINIGMDFNAVAGIFKTLAYFRNFLKSNSDKYVLIRTVDEILEAKKNGLLSVAFDLEGTEPLDGNLDMISLYYELGVRQILMAYNKNNRGGAGCQDEDNGLTEFGREIVKEMNRVGMIVDCSHTGFRSSMEMMELSTDPLVFSHSNPLVLCQHDRNIRDDQIKACANTGGAIGINGIGIFLGYNDTSSQRVFEHIDYIVSLVGWQHVGLGLDYVFDQEELQLFLKSNPEIFPPGKNYESVGFVEPEQWPEITQVMIDKGYTENSIRGILGENWFRVAKQVWKYH